MADIAGLRRGVNGPDITNAITAPQPDEQAIYDVTTPNSFARGLRAGLTGLSAGSYASDALNAELKGDKAKAEAAKLRALALAQEAGEHGPRINSVKQVGGIGDALDYAAGQLGQAAPAIAPVLGGALLGRAGLRGLGPLAADIGTAAGTALPTYQMERGSAALDQYQDPVAAALPADQRDAVALKRAAINTALNTIVPTQALSGAGTQLAKSTLGRVGLTAAEQAALSAGSAKVAQGARSELNPNRDTSADTQELLDAAASGGVASLPFGGIHAAHGIAERAKASGGDFLKTFEKPAGEKAVDDAAHLQAGDEGIQAGATPEDTLQNLMFDREARATKTKEYADQILADPKAPEFVKKQIDSMGGDYENPLSQAQVGAYIGTKFAAEKAQGAYKDLNERIKTLLPANDEKANKQRTKESLALEDTVRSHLKPEALQDPEIRSKLPSLTRAMVSAVSKGGDLSLADVRALGHDTLPSLFDDPKAALADVAKAAKTKDTFSKRLEASSLVETDSMDPKSMLLHSLMPEVRASASPDHIKQLARFMDDIVLHGVAKDKEAGTNDALRSAFGTDENANAVLQYFRDRAEANGLTKDRGGLYESKPTESDLTKTSEHAKNTDYEAANQGITERDAPKAEYVLPGDNKRPLADPDQLRTARETAIGKYADASITEVPFREHIETTGKDLKTEAQKLRTTLAERADSTARGTDQEKITAAKRDLALANKLDDEKLVDTFKVLKVEGKEPNELRATDSDLQSMRQAMDKLGKVATSGNFSFARDNGPDIYVNAESLWKHMADKVKAGESEVSGDKGRIANMFMEGVRSVMARDEVTGIRGGDIPDKTVLDHKTGLTWGDVKPNKEVAKALLEKKENFVRLEARTAKMRDMLQSDDPAAVAKARETLNIDKRRLEQKVANEKDPVQQKVLKEALLKYERLEEGAKEDATAAASSEIVDATKGVTRDKPGITEDSFDAEAAKGDRVREESPNDTQQAMDPTKFAGKWKGSQADFDTVNRITSPELLNRMLTAARAEYSGANPERKLQLGQLAEQVNRRLLNPKAEPVDVKSIDITKAQAEGVFKKFNNQRTGPEGLTPEQKKQVLDDVNRILGPKVKVIFDKDPLFSGSYSKGSGEEAIRIGVHALNPQQVAWHEAVHGIMSRLTGEKSQRAARETLSKAAEAPFMQKRLRDLLKDHPEALDQIKNDREERLAYMYQFWAAGALKVGPDTHGVFEKIFNFVRKLVGAVSESGKVERLFEAIHEGKLSEQSTVTEVLHDLKAETIGDKIKRLGGPVYEGYSKLITSSVDRLHQMNIPAIAELADMFHTPPEREERQQGHTLPFVQARDKAAGQWTNKVSDIVHGLSKETTRLAVDALQEGRVPTDAAAKAVYDKVRSFLDNAEQYLRSADVRRFDPDKKKWVDFGHVKDYFPRVWDKSAIRNNEDGFIAALRKYVSPEQARKTFDMLTQGDGFAGLAERESDLGFTPAAAHVKDRQFTFINKENAHEFSQFQKKDLTDILHTYAMQATHRAEYTRRFGNDGEVIKQKLKEAKDQGASPQELADANKAVQALEGTLGYDMNPKLRELFAGLTVYQNVSLLPLVLFSSLIDPLGVAVRSGEMNEAWNAFREGFKGLGKLYTGSKDLGGDYELARTMGLIDESNMLANTGNSYNGMYMSKWLKNVNNKFFKWNGMETWNDRMRIAAMQSGMRFIQRHALDANEHSGRYMKELGLDGDAKKYVMPTEDGRMAVTKDQFMDRGLSEKEADTAANAVQNALFKFVDGAVLRPNAGHRPIWGSDPHFMLIFHLKQFTYSFENMIKRRVSYEGQHGNFAPAVALAAYVPFMMAADLARGKLTGVSHPDWSMLDYIKHGVARSGISGTDQFLSDAYSDAQHGALPGTTFLGPTFEHAADAVQTAAGAKGHGWRQLLDRSTPMGPILNPIFSAQEHD